MGASVFGNIFTGKGATRAGKGVVRAGKGVERAGRGYINLDHLDKNL